MYEIDNTRKHYLPRMYQRGFYRVNEPDTVYLFDKQDTTKGVQIRSITNVEVSKDAYSAQNDEILTERESVWSQILYTLRESQADELNQHICDRVASASLRAWLARFVVDSALRSHGMRSRMYGFLAETLVSYESFEESMFADLIATYPGSAEELRLMRATLRALLQLDNPRKFAAITLDPFLRGPEGEKRYDLYQDGSWRFDHPPTGRVFITSDIPSTSFHLGPEPQHKNWVWFAMPLTDDLRLTGFCGDARLDSGLIPRSVELDDTEMDVINGSVFRNAERNVYGSSKEELDRIIRLAATVA